MLQGSYTRPACRLEVRGFVSFYHHTFCTNKCAGLSFSCIFMECFVLSGYKGLYAINSLKNAQSLKTGIRDATRT